MLRDILDFPINTPEPPQIRKKTEYIKLALAFLLSFFFCLGGWYILQTQYGFFKSEMTSWDIYSRDSLKPLLEFSMYVSLMVAITAFMIPSFIDSLNAYSNIRYWNNSNDSVLEKIELIILVPFMFWIFVSVIWILITLLLIQVIDHQELLFFVNALLFYSIEFTLFIKEINTHFYRLKFDQILNEVN